MSAIETACEMLKVTRLEPLSVREISEATGYTQNTVDRWVTEMVAHGLLVEVQAAERRPGCGTGKAPMLYRLAPEWGGQAA